MTKFRDALTNIEKRHIEVEGIRTQYFEMGSGDPLLLIHGGGAGADSLGNWYATAPLFAKHFRVIAVDMLGFGGTGKPDPATFVYSQSARTRHIAAFLRKLGLQKVMAIGNSMGGMTATGTCIENPGLISRLVLMGSAGLNRKSREEMRPVSNYDYTREGMERIVRILAHESFVIDDEIVDYRFKLASEPDTHSAYDATMGWIKQQGGLFYEEDFIRQVAVPTLVTGGKNDIIVPLNLGFRFLELIPHSWGYFIPNCGHWAMLEHPEDFAEAATRFLTSERV